MVGYVIPDVNIIHKITCIRKEEFDKDVEDRANLYS